MRANPLGLPIGCQTYPVRKMIAQDFPGTLKQLSDAGFQAIELCSPVGYEEFSGLAKYTPSDLRKIITDTNLECVSSHFGIDELRKDLAGRIEWAKELGLTQILVPSLDGQKIRPWTTSSERPTNTTKWRNDPPAWACSKDCITKISNSRRWTANEPTICCSIFSIRSW